MNNNENALGQRIKLIRIKNGMTLEEFGNQILNANKSVASKWERGVTVPNNKRLLKIAEIGNVTIDYLLSGNPADNLQPEVRQTLGEGKVPHSGNKTFGEKIKELRQKELLTLSKLSEISSISQPYLTQIEKGQRNPSFDIIRKLSEAFEVDFTELAWQAGLYTNEDIQVYRADKTLLSSMTHGEIKEIERYQKENYISSFTDAVQELIRKGLNMSNNQDNK